MTNKNSKLTIYTGMFQFQERIFQNAFDALNEVNALQTPSAHSNHMNWLLGHILHCRFMLINALGSEEENPFGKIYWVAIAPTVYPKIEEILTHFSEISKKLIMKLSTISDHELDSKPEEGRPSLSEIISFFAYHEAYHLGQVGYVRKAIGMLPLKSN